ncbi:ribosomal protein S18 acetylase RimI-like enzyme [Phyllobacterium leguminum]|uniref:Ribosomal protein S18 acetylase RimI-like enzyme n=2 Tax=Phyllobacterium leguminum TaxID=314237 RepID=A0A318TIA7_9HYPH|nr:ribosomal protein S18 acetylase RimI-like enzyme [Phyllobacterium leguminum]
MIKVLDANETRAALPALAEILSDCVNGGASVGFMMPFSPDDGLSYWSRVASEVEAGSTVLLIAEHQSKIVGTVQIGMAQMPNQPHRADVKKLLVHRKARGLGLARQLMESLGTEARKRGKTLLCLDTATGSPAEAIYARLGWKKAGIIPNYALFPDGRYCATTLFYKGI